MNSIRKFFKPQKEVTIMLYVSDKEKEVEGEVSTQGTGDQPTKPVKK